MGFIIGLLTLFMVLDCLVLVLLVLIQLPKKEAGVGVAFGGAATDALFGAGSGNVLTKTTKYAAIIFFVLSAFLSLLQGHMYHRPASEFKQQVQQAEQGTPAPAPVARTEPEAQTAPTSGNAGSSAAPVNTNILGTLTGVEKSAAAGSNAPAPSQK